MKGGEFPDNERQGLDNYAGGNVEEKLKRRPLLVFFYMDGCSHCEVTKPHWEKLKKKYGRMMMDVESANVPSTEGVNGFPTLKYKPQHGDDRTISGEQHSAGEIERKLGLRRGLTRRRPRRLSRRVSRRRFGH